MIATLFHRTRLAVALPLLAAAVSFTPNPALADTQPPRAYVQTHDLDLATPAGIAALDKRLSRAVQQVCPMTTVGVDALVARDRCMHIAWQGITPQRVAVLAAAERRTLGAVAVADIALPAAAGSANGL